MKGTIFERRRAERFAELLDEADGGRRRRHINRGSEADLAPLVALGHRVAAVPVPVEPDQEFRVGLRAMLMATIERDGIGATAVDRGDDRAGVLDIAEAPPERCSRARAAVLVGITAGALALSGVSAASGDAMPGDALYGVKRNSERAQLALAGSDVSRGTLYLEFARTRLGEAGRTTPDRLAAVLADMDAHTRDGVRILTTAAVDRRDPGPLGAVETFVARQRVGLETLAARSDPAGWLRAAESGRLLDAITHRTKDLRAAIACGRGGARLDQLGPLPRACETDPPAGTKPRRPAGGVDTAPGGRDDPTNPPVVGTAERTPTTPTPSTTGPVVVTTAPAVPPPVLDLTDDGGVLDEVGQVLGDLLG